MKQKQIQVVTNARGVKLWINVRICLKEIIVKRYQ